MTTLVTGARARRAGAAVLAAAALLGVSVSAGAMLLRMYAVAGEVAPPVIAFAALPALAAAGVLLGRRHAPLAGAVFGGLIALMLAPHLGHTLAVPADTMFAPFVALFASSLLACVTGGVAAAQVYGRALPRLPRWVPVNIGAVAGAAGGIFLMAAFTDGGAVAGIGPETLARLPAVETDRFEFVQQEIRVRAGETVALRLENRDAASHSFDIDEFDVHVLMPANATTVAIFAADRPGVYTFYCAPHYDRKSGKGMKGTLVVEAAQ